MDPRALKTISPSWRPRSHRVERPGSWPDAMSLGDTSMPRLQSKLLDADQIPFDDMKRWTPIKERGGLDDWRGRFWLPDGDRVDTTRKYCLIRDDGRTGEMVMDQFITSEAAEDKRNSLAMSVSLTI